ncbi:MAG TPA: hypothetical protein VKV79_00630, partial [Terriglobia bacterium]|nr:hypothetical protein [Terriglobia bacterium]
VDEMHAAENEPEGGVTGSARFYAALALERLGHADESTRMLDALVSEPPNGHRSAYSYYIAGLVEDHRRQNGKAAAYFRRALELDPELWQARIELQRRARSE